MSFSPLLGGANFLLAIPSAAAAAAHTMLTAQWSANNELANFLLAIPSAAAAAAAHTMLTARWSANNELAWWRF